MTISTKELFRVFNLDSKSTNSNLRRAFIALGDEEYASATQSFEHYLCNDPDSAAAWLGKLMAEKRTNDISKLCYGKELIGNVGFLHAKECASNDEELNFLKKLELLSEINRMKISNYDASLVCNKELCNLKEHLSEGEKNIKKETFDTKEVSPEDESGLDKLEHRLNKLTTLDTIRVLFILVMVPLVLVLLILLKAAGIFDVCEFTKLGRDSVIDIGFAYLLTTVIFSIPFCLFAFIITLPFKLMISPKVNAALNKIDLIKRKIALPELQNGVTQYKKEVEKYEVFAASLNALAKQLSELGDTLFKSSCNAGEVSLEPLTEGLEKIYSCLRDDNNSLISEEKLEEIQQILCTNGGNIVNAFEEYDVAKEKAAEEEARSHSTITTTYGESMYNKYRKQYGYLGEDRTELHDADSAAERKKHSDIMDNI